MAKGDLVRRQAITIANSLAEFDTSSIKEYKWRKSNTIAAAERMAMAAPDIHKWPFIDLDPLLGQVDYYMFDDGARATWPLDFAVCNPLDDFNLDWRITYTKTLTPQEARRKGCRIFSPKMLLVESVQYVNGQFSSGDAVISLLGGKWADAFKGPITRSEDMLGLRNGTRDLKPDLGDLLAGMALRFRYEWSAIFSMPNGLNLRFGTTPKGALSLFKDREKLNSEYRRGPLLHWVSRHWRRGQTTAETLIEIRRHLRGKEQIKWYGIPVTIVPAEFEIETYLKD